MAYIDNVQNMETRIAVDLKVFRRRSGLSQADVAHLLGVHRSHVSKFENGRREPSVEHVAVLCLVYGLRVPEFCFASLPQFEGALSERLKTLPNKNEPTAGPTTRDQTLTTLTKRLAASLAGYDD